MIGVELQVDSVSMPEIERYVRLSVKLANWQTRFMRDVMRGTKDHFMTRYLGFSTRPFRYIRSWHVAVVLDGNAEGRMVYNTAPTAVMVEYGAMAQGIYSVLGYRPLAAGIDAAISKWAGRVIQI